MSASVSVAVTTTPVTISTRGRRKSVRALGSMLGPLGALAIVAGAGCSGGQQSGGAPPRAMPVVGPTANAVVPAGSGAASLRVVIPAAVAGSATHRRPAYISPATNSLTFSQNGGAAQTIALTPTSPNCTSSAAGRTCTVNIGASAGNNQTFSIKLFASSDGTGTPLSAQTLVATIVANQNNPLTVTLNGVVASLSVALANASLQYGEPGATSVVVNALDASGNTIVGPGAFADANGSPLAVTLADSDTTGSTALAQTTVNGPATIALNYNGGGITSASISASAGNLASSPAVLSFLCGRPSATNPLYVSAEFQFGSGGASPAPRIVGYGEFPLTTSGVGLSPASQVDVPGSYAIRVDGRGYAYTSAAASPGPFVAQYCPSASGAATPYRSYVVPNAAFIDDVAIDTQSDVFALVSSVKNPSISEFAPDSGGIGFPSSSSHTTVAATISGGNTRLVSAVSLNTDANGTLYVGNRGQVTEYARGASGNVPPTKTLTNTAGGLIDLFDEKLDAAGNVYALYRNNNLSELDPASPFGTYALVEYAHGSYSTPMRVISGAATQIGTYLGNTYTSSTVRGIAVDPSGNVYVLNEAYQYNAAANNYTVYHAVAQFGPAANGNVAPATSFPVTGINDYDLAADANGTVAVAEADGYGVLLYKNGAYNGQLAVSPTVGLTYGIAYDGAGALYVQSRHYTDVNGNQHGANAILTYPPNANPNSTPTNVNPVTQNHFRLAVDTNGNVYGQTSPAGVDEYAPNTTSGTASSSFSDSILADADFASGLGVDSAGNVYLGSTFLSVINVFAAGSSGNAVQPQASYFDLSATTLGAAVALDASGNVYAASCDTNSIGVYPAGATGGPPTRSLVGPKTLIACPTSITVDAAGNIYAVNVDYSDALITVFGPGANGNVAPMQTISSTSSMYFDQVAIGSGFGSPSAAAAARSVAAHGTFGLSLQSGLHVAGNASAPACPVSTRVAVAADARYPHAPPTASGQASMHDCRRSDARLHRSSRRHAF